jgi:hypothetical protein
VGPARKANESIEGSAMDRSTMARLMTGGLEPDRRRSRRDAHPRSAMTGAGTCAAIVAAAALMFASSAQASFLPPEMMDSAAMYIAWFVVIVMPIAGIVLFWMLHVLPEKIAHQRHHPQRDAIHVLCLLSLLFGGLLWPIAWLWAYTKPTAYKLAYGTAKHDDYYHGMGEKAKAGELLEHELTHLREELDAMAERGALTPALKVLRRDLDAAQASSGASPANGAPA